MSGTQADGFEAFARSWRAYVLVALIALASATFGSFSAPVMDRDEARFAQATRQMVESGDYVRIRLQQAERSKKPVGIYWLQAAAVNALRPLTHSTNTIWTYRIPSALGALLAALAALWAGRRLLGPRAALLGAAMFAASILMGVEAMTAKTDAALAGVTTLAMAALAHLYAGAQRPRLLALLFWTAMGAGVLIKGPVTPLVAFLTLITIGVWEGRWRWMKPLVWWPGPLLMLAIVAPWLIAINQATEGRFFAEAIGRDLGGKISGDSEHHSGWPGYHLIVLLIALFPATFALPFAARLGWRTLRAPRAEEGMRGLRFLLAWAIPSFVAFEILPTKLPHYTLPLYPAIALLAGAGLLAAAEQRWRMAKWIGVAFTLLAGLVFVAAFAGAREFFAPGAEVLGYGLMAGAAFAALIAVVAAIFVRSTTLRVVAGVVCALGVSCMLREVALPRAQGVQLTSQIVDQLDRSGLGSRPIWVVGYGEASLVFMTRTDINIGTAADAIVGLHAGDTLIVDEEQRAETEVGLRRRGLEFAPQTPDVRGHNLGNSHDLTLSIGVVRPIARD
ncbi:ArnT family glycosyltransferase [Terricaulis sp.]|uniref:ArnT family glycosyltransferase n=1 Tax=Terricaulis sp. TaxID=2768686 RepID=UPI003784035E